ncbi:gag-pol polyprotein [Ophiostoma piceae UAMH 11346]|uniref:Gag-pol polyprotein n=1 Tax=Ophiostoma piceae (strain UAMH 11346) TaxID=1262450 RepID=S3CSH4_OPHP1|nr:gag-pol polyprotein [Ophiostoma piceae UAMH 11346]
MPIEAKYPTWRLVQWRRNMAQEDWVDARLRMLAQRDEDMESARQAVEGDLVLCWDSRRSKDMSYAVKLSYRWQGPYVVRKVHDNGSYILEQPNGAVLARRFNGDLLRKMAQDEYGVWQDVHQFWWDDPHQQEPQSDTEEENGDPVRGPEDEQSEGNGGEPFDEGTTMPKPFVEVTIPGQVPKEYSGIPFYLA